MATAREKVDAFVLANVELSRRYMPLHIAAAEAGVTLDELKGELYRLSRGKRIETTRATGSDPTTHVTTCMFEPPTPTLAQIETFGDELPAHQHPQTQRLETSFDKCLRVSFEPTFDNTTRRYSTQTSFKARVFETLHIESGPLYPLPSPQTRTCSPRSSSQGRRDQHGRLHFARSPLELGPRQVLLPLTYY
jgi:hypothetical protein